MSILGLADVAAAYLALRSVEQLGVEHARAEMVEVLDGYRLSTGAMLGGLGAFLGPTQAIEDRRDGLIYMQRFWFYHEVSLALSDPDWAERFPRVSP